MEEKIKEKMTQYLDAQKCDTNGDLNKLSFNKKKIKHVKLISFACSFAVVLLVFVICLPFFFNNKPATVKNKVYAYDGEIFYVNTTREEANNVILNNCYLPNLQIEPLIQLINGEDNLRLGCLLNYEVNSFDYWTVYCYYINEKYIVGKLPIYGVLTELTWNDIDVKYNISTDDEVFYSYEFAFTQNGIYQYFRILSVTQYEIVNLLDTFFA